VPSVPLTELYNAAGEYIRARRGELRLRAAVDSFCAEESFVDIRSGGQQERFDFAVLAVPFDGLRRILPMSPEAQPLNEALEHFESSPITGIHLWLDGEISDLEHAVLLDRTIQWMFHKSRLLGREAGGGSYVELVVSSSKGLVDKSRTEIIDLALKELREFFPRARNVNIVKATVIKEVSATYSPRPGLDKYRPGNKTGWARVFLAGDWTATGWPATMEGAVRSGYLAAEALARAAGDAGASYLVPDLPSKGFMRLFRS
jgi:zeta-carotene desaturase